MKKIFLLLSLISALTLKAEIFNGIEFSGGDAAFADEVVYFTPGTYGISGHTYSDNSKALHAPDYQGGKLDGKTALSLGNGGSLIVAFTDNILTTSGDNKLDLWIFEVGSLVEKAEIAVSTDGINWIEVGNIEGSTSGVDLDSYIGKGIKANGQYRFVRIIDDYKDRSDKAPYAGADIDAIGAITTVVVKEETVEPQPQLPQCDTLQAQIDTLNNQLQQQNTKTDKCNAKVDALSNQLQECNMQLQTTSTALEEQKQIAQCLNANQGLQKDLEKVNGQLQTLKTEISAYKEENKTLQQALDQCNSTTACNSLETELAELKVTVTDLKSSNQTIKTLQDKMQQLEDENKEKQAQIEKLQQDNLILQAKFKEANENRQSIAKQFLSLKERNDQIVITKEQCDKDLTTMTELKAQCDKEKAQCEVQQIQDDDKDGIVNQKDYCPETPEGEVVDFTGCALDKPLILQGVNFHTDSDELTEESLIILNRVVKTLLENPQVAVEIGGHTDSRGSLEYNIDLSQRRAESVKNYFIQQGVETSRLQAKGYGPNVPIATNDTKEGRAKNRRVELKRLDNAE